MKTTTQILVGDVRARLRELPDASVHCVVTSPPYWSLRDYGVEGQIGREPTVDAWVETLVDVFDEVRRVLRPDGVMWLNVGDSYASDPPGNDRPDHTGSEFLATRGQQRGSTASRGQQSSITGNLKPKDLVMQPARLALALHAAGWWIRADNVWEKPNPMPESMRDRPTKSHEYVFLLSRSETYYYDPYAVQQPWADDRAGASGTRVRIDGAEAGGKRERTAESHQRGTSTLANGPMMPGRNLRSVWRIPTEGFGYEMCRACRQIYTTASWRRLPLIEQAAADVPKNWATATNGAHGAVAPGSSATKRRCRCGSDEWVSHFATFPSALVDPCIRAGTSENGCCAECGAPSTRIVEREATGRVRERSNGGLGASHRREPLGLDEVDGQFREGVVSRTTGWRPTCRCENADRVPCTVLDPFGGSMKTAIVAAKLQRSSIAIELNPDYVELGERALADATGKLFHSVERR